jgi:hypothetical protein
LTSAFLSLSLFSSPSAAGFCCFLIFPTASLTSSLTDTTALDTANLSALCKGVSSRLSSFTPLFLTHGISPHSVGYVNELLSRLTNNRRWAAADRTQVNHTLDSSASTFPLDRSIYADFSHDNQITAILAAIGLKKDAVALPSTGPPSSGQVWKTSQIVPFGGKLVSERLLCGKVEYVRFLIVRFRLPLPSLTLPFVLRRIAHTLTLSPSAFPLLDIERSTANPDILLRRLVDNRSLLRHQLRRFAVVREEQRER